MNRITLIAIAGLATAFVAGCDQGDPSANTNVTHAASKSEQAQAEPVADKLATETPVKADADNSLNRIIDKPGKAEEEKKPVVTPKPVAAGGLGQIDFTATEHDFGKVSDTESLEHNFRFTNSGDGPLIIKDVKTSCGCTTTKLAKTEFEPGEGDEIEVKFKPKGGGRQTKYITVITASPDSSDIKTQRLAISAEVIPVVGMEPRSLQFGTVDRGIAETLTATVYSQDPGFVIKSVRVNGENVSARIAGDPRIIEEVEPISMPQSQVVKAAEQDIEVVLHDDAPTGRFFRQISVVVEAASEPGKPRSEHTQTLLVHANIVGDIQTQPQYLRMPVLNQGENFSKDLILTRRSGDPFKILDVRVEDSNIEGLEISTEPYTEGGLTGYRITLAGNAGAHAGSFRGYLVVETDVPREGETKVMFNGVVRAPRPTPAINRPTGGS
ncbi:MAG: DUF1573 domain-containing protein [Phycisphaerales bacterium]